MSAVSEQSVTQPAKQLALVVGNSRLHWGLVTSSGVITAWDTPHWDEATIAAYPSAVDQPAPDRETIRFQTLLRNLEYPDRLSFIFNESERADLIQSVDPPMWLASVVSTQAQHWQSIFPVRVITLNDIPLHNLYETLGIDRALALVGAVREYGAPALVVDGGTALTFSGVDGDRRFVGGAIAPGLGLQGRSLAQSTAALPDLDATAASLPCRWATQTPDAMRSGIIYTMCAGIEEFLWDWWQDYPNSAVVFTGGDGEFFYKQMQRRLSNSSALVTPRPSSVTKAAVNLHYCSTLIFEGICALI